MQKPLQAASDALDQLLLPASLLQLAVVGGSILLGWWIARLVRPRFASNTAPDDLPSRGREIAWVASPYVITLLVVAGLVGRLRVPAADGKPYVKQ